ncbi:MAG: exodeoxyribonuclease VII small subunit [Deltaproteobacteria bacterium]|nr:exodeoxyribonuclease VII small subunit [Deltaproteobacteria bacterium]MBW1718666.1 exodeoxyribonuclease VII small subunit [Deltaproteobacteria bacterium]MBW1932009.1 exodeoxyribonuclease VII small subunit [Deltaproteobacteria bacterium]MBW1937758.1 exodeoxyribonuclease VII small subunit [Deltaproteobacteria bacterium]MBW1964415.1 exodeoxyribonuclease VII small subunit [Deltaproteobacteria bacterium]
MNKKLDFEKALKELENLVKQLEENDLPLKESLKSFEHGIKLSRYCVKCLDDAEKRIQQLSRDENNEPMLKAWEGDSEDL